MTTTEMFNYDEREENSRHRQPSTQGVLTPEAEIAADITEQLMDDPRTQDCVIEVVNRRGVITLVGTVESRQSREAAEEIANAHPNVISVINGLKVKQ